MPGRHLPLISTRTDSQASREVSEQRFGQLHRWFLRDLAFVRWTLFSLLSFALVVGLTALLHELFAVNKTLAFLIPLVVAFLFNFVTMRYIVYGRPTMPIGRQFVGYAASALAFRGIEFLTYVVLMDLLAVWYLLAVLLVMPASFVVKFVYYRLLLFGPKASQSRREHTASDELANGEASQLASLHMRCLPTSLVARFGHGYATAFYRYIGRSDKELLLVSRNKGELVAAGILSFAPQTLGRRLVLRTSLPLHLLLRLPQLGASRICAWTSREDEQRASRSPCHQPRISRDLPELILLYTSPEVRGRGHASQLLRRCEEILAIEGYDAYVVKTIDDESNPARDYYLGRGFTEHGGVTQHGKRLQVLTKQLLDQSVDCRVHVPI